MQDSIVDRLTPIFKDIFNPDVVITKDLDASQIPEWDSLNHIALVVAIEEAFRIEFTTVELAEMATVGDLIMTLEAKGVA